MNKFIEWLQSLTPEFYIIFTLLILLFILILFALNRIGSIRRNLFRDSLILTEDMISLEQTTHSRIKITNVSFYNVIIHEYGLMQKNIKIPIKTARITIDERADITETYLSDEIRSMFSKSKFKRIYLYTVDSSNKIKIKNLKELNKYIKLQIKLEKKAEKLRLKNIRFEEGNFNFIERVVLILGIIVSPLVKLFRLLTRKTNSGLHKRNKKIEEKNIIEVNDPEITEEILIENEFEEEIIDENITDYFEGNDVEENDDTEEYTLD